MVAAIQPEFRARTRKRASLRPRSRPCARESGYPRFSPARLGRRFYSPSLGKWLSRDPKGEFGTVNVHAFVNNAPTFSVDSLGMAAVFIQGMSSDQGWSEKDAKHLKAVKDHMTARVTAALEMLQKHGPKAKRIQLNGAPVKLPDAIREVRKFLPDKEVRILTGVSDDEVLKELNVILSGLGESDIPLVVTHYWHIGEQPGKPGLRLGSIAMPLSDVQTLLEKEKKGKFTQLVLDCCWISKTEAETFTRKWRLDAVFYFPNDYQEYMLDIKWSVPQGDNDDLVIDMRWKSDYMETAPLPSKQGVLPIVRMSP